jgi:hypothetical protein
LAKETIKMTGNTIIAFCGLVCSNCEGYLATQADNETWKERLAVHARDAYGQKDATAASVTCDGCTSGKRMCAYCRQCEVRACAVDKGIAHCGECEAFESCQIIQAFLQNVPEARQTFAQYR